VIKQRSDFGFDQTVARLKADIRPKGIRFFDEIDHQKLGASADLPIGRSTLLLFGNPAARRSVPAGQPARGPRLAGAYARHRGYRRHGLDQLVRLPLVANRYQLEDRDPQIAMAGEVAASIASAARK